MNHQQNAPATRRSPRLLARTAAAALVVGLGACAPITTQEEYAASDGVRVDVSETVRVENLMVVTSAQGEPGAVQGAVANRGSEDVTIEIGDLSVDVEAGSNVLIGGDDGEELLIDAVAEPPGANLDLMVGAAGTEGELVHVPVLDGTLPEYTDLVPTS